MSKLLYFDAFEKVEKLVNETEIYAKTKNPYKKSKSEYFTTTGEGFNYRDFMFENQENEVWRIIKFLVESDIPNSFYVMSWDEYFNSENEFYKWLDKNRNSDFGSEFILNRQKFDLLRKKGMWEVFAIVLACKGVNNVLDVAKPLLCKFVDYTCLYGLIPLTCLISNNLLLFKKDIVECLYLAFEKEETAWIVYLLSLLSLNYDIKWKYGDKVDKEKLDSILTVVN